MSNQDNKKTFWDLLETPHIQIPALQRDYAQGRADKENLRKKFVGVLWTALKEEKPTHLDFIYGYTKDNAFIPLDGQQRLTTLFLLHTYLAAKAEKLKETKDKLAKFSYATRVSTREFCQALVNHLSLPSDENLKAHLQDQAWFLPHWIHDPSVEGMLTMLQEIHKQCPKDPAALWENTASITFAQLNMGDYNLGEELYIKMNARGKQLTNFEIFKNQWYKKLRENSTLDKSKMDNAWARLFWDQDLAKSILADPNKQANPADSAFLKFINRFFFWKLLTNSENQGLQSEDLKKLDFGKLLQENLLEENLSQEESQQITLPFTEPKEVQSLGNMLDKIATCCAVVDLLNGKDSKLYQPFDTSDPEKQEKLQLLNNTTYRGLFLFGVLMEVLSHDQESNEELHKVIQTALRIARNFAETMSINADNLQLALKRMQELVFSSHKNLLASVQQKWESTTEGYNQTQAQEEARKANLISTNPDWAKALHRAEDYDYFRGRVGYLLDYANVDCAQGGNKDDLARFEKVVCSAKILFNDNSEFINKPHFYLQRLLWIRSKAWSGALLRHNECYFWNTDKSNWIRFLREIATNESRKKVLKALFTELLTKENCSLDNIKQVVLDQLKTVHYEDDKDKSHKEWSYGSRFHFLAASTNDTGFFDLFEAAKDLSLFDFPYIQTWSSLYFLKGSTFNAKYAEIQTLALYLACIKKFGKRIAYQETGGFGYVCANDRKFKAPTLEFHFKGDKDTWGAYRLDVTVPSYKDTRHKEQSFQVAFHINKPDEQDKALPDGISDAFKQVFANLITKDAWKIAPWQPQEDRKFDQALVAQITINKVENGQANFTTINKLADAIHNLHRVLNLGCAVSESIKHE